MPQKSAASEIWVRKGDHRREGEELIEKNVRENGGRLVGEPSVILREYPGGIFTLLSASGAWWCEEMRLHPAWGEPMHDEGDYFDLLDSIGEKRRGPSDSETRLTQP